MRTKRVLVTGARGFLGSRFVNAARRRGYEQLVLVGSKEYDLTEQDAVRSMFKDITPEIVVHLAGYVGGIGANRARPADFLYRNALMNTLVIHEAQRAGTEKLLTCIGGCSYPKDVPSPIAEDMLWQGFPQPESAPYSLAKALSALQCQAYRTQFGFSAITLVPGNLYGSHDNFSLTNGHVIPALIHRMFLAKWSGQPSFTAWGSGRPTRDFVFVEDVAECLVTALETYDRPEIVNISTGTETSIRSLVEAVKEAVGYAGEVIWDTSKPDGQMRKIFDVGRMRALGWACPTALRDGLENTVRWFSKNYDLGRVRT